MFFVVHWSLIGTPAETAAAAGDMKTLLDSVLSLKLLDGVAIASPKSQKDVENFVMNVVNVEQHNDPVLDVAMFMVDDDSWYLVSEAVPDTATARKITGRDPFVP